AVPAMSPMASSALRRKTTLTALTFHLPPLPARAFLIWQNALTIFRGTLIRRNAISPRPAARRLHIKTISGARRLPTIILPLLPCGQPPRDGCGGPRLVVSRLRLHRAIISAVYGSASGAYRSGESKPNPQNGDLGRWKDLRCGYIRRLQTLYVVEGLK